MRNLLQIVRSINIKSLYENEGVLVTKELCSLHENPFDIKFAKSIIKDLYSSSYKLPFRTSRDFGRIFRYKNLVNTWFCHIIRGISCLLAKF